MPTAIHHSGLWTAHVLPLSPGPVPIGRIEVYRSGTFAGCLYYRSDGRVRSMDAGLRPVAEWVASLVPRAQA